MKNRLGNVVACGVALLLSASIAMAQTDRNNGESKGKLVNNQKREEMGKIDNLLMHPNSGKVAYATLDIGTYAGKGNELTNVPWDLVRQSKKDSPGFVVNADKAKLQGATYFDRNKSPDYGDRAWQTNTYGYYGFEPYWTHPMIY